MGKIALIILKLAVSAALLYFATRQLDVGAVTARLSRIDPLWLISAVVLALLQYALVALRWQHVCQICGAPMTMVTAIRFYMIGAFFGQVFPSVGGDAARILLLARHGAGG